MKTSHNGLRGLVVCMSIAVALLTAVAGAQEAPKEETKEPPRALRPASASAPSPRSSRPR